MYKYMFLPLSPPLSFSDFLLSYNLLIRGLQKQAVNTTLTYYHFYIYFDFATLAKGCLFTHPAVTEQHYHLSLRVSGNLLNVSPIFTLF